MTKRARRRRRSLEQWRRLIEEHAASDQTVTAFCAAHDLGKSTFQRWRNRLTSDTKPAVASEPPTQGLFTPLLAEQTASPADAIAEHGWDIELDLGGGICLRLRRNA